MLINKINNIPIKLMGISSQSLQKKKNVLSVLWQPLQSIDSIVSVTAESLTPGIPGGNGGSNRDLQ